MGKDIIGNLINLNFGRKSIAHPEYYWIIVQPKYLEIESYMLHMDCMIRLKNEKVAIMKIRKHPS